MTLSQRILNNAINSAIVQLQASLSLKYGDSSLITINAVRYLTYTLKSAKSENDVQSILNRFNSEYGV